MSLVIGSVVGGRYKVESQLGQGGMGTVYRAWDRHDQTPCAIKHITTTDPAILDQLKTEADLLRRTRSAHVPRLIDHLLAIDVPGQVLVMEFIEGDDLETLVMRGPLPERDVLTYCLHVLEGLMHLHLQRPSIIHRDIKPANIRVDRYGSAWLLDLGIGQMVGAPLALGAQAGTPAYAPPEQIQLFPADASSDIYALGATLYHLLTGTRPPTAGQRLSGTQLVPPSQYQHLSKETEELVIQALELDPDSRFQTAEIMHRAVEQIVDRKVEERYKFAEKLRETISENMWQAITATRMFPPQRGVHRNVDPPLSRALVQALGERPLYLHQAESIERVRSDRDIVVATGTGSGKSLCYNIPVLERCLNDPRAHALYLFPTKALINDQAHSLRRFVQRMGHPEITVRELHGDLSDDERQMAKTDPPRIALSNPEFLHWMLARHPQWRRLLSRLQFIILDEVHIYRGVFGSHVAQLLRRLLRLCRIYESTPLFISASATIGNPAELVRELTGRTPYVIDRNGAERVRRHFTFWQPIEIGKEHVRRAADDDAVLITTRAVESKLGLQTLTFARARQEVEHLLAGAQSGLREKGLDPSIYAAYRGGYTRQDRERIEAGLRDGAVRGAFSTSALELGIDIGGVQMAVLTGYPGTRMSFQQQAGRAGRRSEDGHVVLVARSNPLDHYYMRHPDELLHGAPEAAIIDLNNSFILEQHLCCMASEQPIREAEIDRFDSGARQMFWKLVKTGTLLPTTDCRGAVEY